VKKVGVAYDVNKKIAQGCQGGTRQILKVDTQYYHFQQKNCIYTQLDGHAMVLLDYLVYSSRNTEEKTRQFD